MSVPLHQSPRERQHAPLRQSRDCSIPSPRARPVDGSLRVSGSAWGRGGAAAVPAYLLEDGGGAEGQGQAPVLLEVPVRPPEPPVRSRPSSAPTARRTRVAPMPAQEEPARSRTSYVPPKSAVPRAKKPPPAKRKTRRRPRKTGEDALRELEKRMGINYEAERARKENAMQNIADDVHSATTSRRAAATWLKSLDIESYEQKHFAPLSDELGVELVADAHGTALRKEERTAWEKEARDLELELDREGELSPRALARLDFAKQHVHYVETLPQAHRTRALGMKLNKGMRARHALQAIAKALGWVPHERHLQRNRDLSISGGKLFGDRREDTDEAFLERQRHKSVGAVVMVTTPLNETWAPADAADHLVGVTGAPPAARAALVEFLSETQSSARIERVVLPEFDAYTALTLAAQHTEVEAGDAAADATKNAGRAAPPAKPSQRARDQPATNELQQQQPASADDRVRAAQAGAQEQAQQQAMEDAQRKKLEREAQRVALEGDGWHKRSYERTRLAGAELQWRAVAESVPYSDEDRRHVCEVRIRDSILKGSRALSAIDGKPSGDDAAGVIAGDLLALSAVAAAWELALQDNDDATGTFGKPTQPVGRTVRQLDASTVAVVIGLLETYGDRIAPPLPDNAASASAHAAAAEDGDPAATSAPPVPTAQTLVDLTRFRSERVEPWLILVCACGTLFQVMLNSDNMCSMLLEMGAFQALVKAAVACAAVGNECETAEAACVDAATEDYRRRHGDEGAYAKTGRRAGRPPARPAPTRVPLRLISQLSRLVVALSAVSIARLFFFAPPEHRQLLEAMMHLEVDKDDSDESDGGDDADDDAAFDDASFSAASTSRFSRMSSMPMPSEEPEVEETLLNPRYHGFAYAITYLSSRPPLHFFGMSSQDLVAWNDDAGVESQIDPRLDDWIGHASQKLNVHLPWAYLPATCRPKAPVVIPATTELASRLCASVLYEPAAPPLTLIKPRPEVDDADGVDEHGFVHSELPESLDDALNVYPEPMMVLRGMSRWKRYAIVIVGRAAYDAARGVKYDGAHRKAGSLVTPPLKVGPCRATEFRATDAIARIVRALVPPYVKAAAGTEEGALELARVENDCCYAALHAVVPFTIGAMVIASEDAGMRPDGHDNNLCAWDSDAFVAFALRALTHHLAGTEDAALEASSTVSHHVGLWRYIDALPGLRVYVNRADPFDSNYAHVQRVSANDYLSGLNACLGKAPMIVMNRLALGTSALGAFGDTHIERSGEKLPHNERSIAGSFTSIFAGGWGLGSRCGWQVLPEETSRALLGMVRRRRFLPPASLRVVSTSRVTARNGAKGLRTTVKVRLAPTMETRPLLPYAAVCAARLYLHGDELTLNGDDNLSKTEMEEFKAQDEAEAVLGSRPSLVETVASAVAAAAAGRPDAKAAAQGVLRFAQRKRLVLSDACLRTLCETAHRALHELEQVMSSDGPGLATGTGDGEGLGDEIEPVNVERALRALSVAMGGLAFACQKSPRAVAHFSGARRRDPHNHDMGSKALSEMLGGGKGGADDDEGSHRARPHKHTTSGDRYVFNDSFSNPENMGAMAAIRNVLTSETVPPSSLAMQCATCCAWLLANCGPGNETMWPRDDEVPWLGDGTAHAATKSNARMTRVATVPDKIEANVESMVVYKSLLSPDFGTQWCARAFRRCVKGLHVALETYLEYSTTVDNAEHETGHDDDDANRDDGVQWPQEEERAFDISDFTRCCTSCDMAMGTIWMLIEVDEKAVREALETVDRSNGWSEATYKFWEPGSRKNEDAEVARRLDATLFAQLVDLACRDVQKVREANSEAIVTEVLRLKGVAARLSFQLIAKDKRCRDIAIEMDAGSKLDDMLQSEERDRAEEIRNLMVSQASQASDATGASAGSNPRKSPVRGEAEGEGPAESFGADAARMREAQKQLDELKGIVAATRLLLLDHEDDLKRQHKKSPLVEEASSVASSDDLPEESESVKLVASALTKLMDSREEGIREVGVRGAAILAREHKSIGQHGVVASLRGYLAVLKPTYRRSDRRRQAIALAAILNLSQSNKNKALICENFVEYLYSAQAEARASAQKRPELFALVTASLYTSDGGIGAMFQDKDSAADPNAPAGNDFGTLVLGSDEIAAAEDDRDDHRDLESEHRAIMTSNLSRAQIAAQRNNREVADRKDKGDEFHKQNIRLCIAVTRLSCAVLYNISTLTRNRTPMYKVELSRKKFLVDHTEAEVLFAAHEHVNGRGMSDEAKIRVMGRWNAARVVNKFKAQHEKKHELIQLWSPPPAPEVLVLARFVVRTHAERAALESLDARCVRAPRYLWQHSSTGEWERAEDVATRQQASTGVDFAASRMDGAMMDETGDYVVMESQLATIEAAGSPLVVQVLKRGKVAGADPVVAGVAPASTGLSARSATTPRRSDAIENNAAAFSKGPGRLTAASHAALQRALRPPPRRGLEFVASATASKSESRCELAVFLKRYSARMRRTRADGEPGKAAFVRGEELYECLGDAFPNMRPFELDALSSAVRKTADPPTLARPQSARRVADVRFSHAAMIKALAAYARSTEPRDASNVSPMPRKESSGDGADDATRYPEVQSPDGDARVAPPATRLSLYHSAAVSPRDAAGTRSAGRKRPQSAGASSARHRPEEAKGSPRWALRNELQKPVRPFYGDAIDFEEEGLTLREKTRASCWSPRVQQLEVVERRGARKRVQIMRHSAPSSGGAQATDIFSVVKDTLKDAPEAPPISDTADLYDEPVEAEVRHMIGAPPFHHASGVGSMQFAANSGRVEDTERHRVEGRTRVVHLRPSFDDVNASRGRKATPRGADEGIKPLPRALSAPPPPRGRGVDWKEVYGGDVVSISPRDAPPPQPGQRAAASLAVAAAPSRTRNRFVFGQEGASKSGNAASASRSASAKKVSRDAGRLVAFAAVPGSKIAEELFPPPVFFPQETGAHSRPYHVHHTRLIVDEIEVCWRAIPAPRSLHDLLGWEPGTMSSDNRAVDEAEPSGADVGGAAQDTGTAEPDGGSSRPKYRSLHTAHLKPRRHSSQPEQNVPSPPPSAAMSRPTAPEKAQPAASTRPRKGLRAVRASKAGGAPLEGDQRPPPTKHGAWPGDPTGRTLALWCAAKSLTPLCVPDAMDAYIADLDDGLYEPICSDDYGAAFDAFLKHTLTDYYDIARDLPRLLSCGNGVDALQGESPPIVVHATPSPIVPLLPDEDDHEQFYDEDPITALPYVDDGPKRDGAFSRDRRYFKSHGKTSIFAPRVFESEMGALVEGRSPVELFDDEAPGWETDDDPMVEDHFYPGNEPMLEAATKPMRRDWERCVAKERFRRMCKGANGAKELKQLEDAFAQCHRFLSNAYMYYSCLNQKPFDEFGVCLNAWNIFVDNAHALQGRPERRAVSDLVFLEANLEEGDKRHVDNVANDDHALVRFEFCEAVIRMALAASAREGVSDKGVVMIGKPSLSPADALIRFVEDVEARLAGGEATLNPDWFRRRRMYRKSTNRVLRRRERVLRSIFVYFSTSTPWSGKHAPGAPADPRPGKKVKGTPAPDEPGPPPPALATVPEPAEAALTKGEKQLMKMSNGLSCSGWIRFLDECGVLFTDVTGISRREAILCFNWSRPVFVDELRMRQERSCLKWTYFLEAVCRLADCMSPPEDREMELLLQPDLAAPIPKASMRKLSSMDLPRKGSQKEVSFSISFEEKLRARPAAYRYYTKLIRNSARRAALYVQERGGEARKNVQMATGLGSSEGVAAGAVATDKGESRPSMGFLSPKTRPLARKIVLMCDWIFWSMCDVHNLDAIEELAPQLERLAELV